MSDNKMIGAGTILSAQLESRGDNYSEEMKEILAPLEKAAGEICASIREGIEDYYKSAGETPDTLIFGMWNVFAGIGCVGLLEDKKEAFAVQDVYECLIKPEGITNLDEHVIKTEGLDADEVNGTALEAAKKGAQAYAKTFMSLPHEDKPAQIREYEKACLLFGAAWQLNRKGRA